MAELMMTHRNPINTHKTAERFRERAIDVPNRKILISRLAGSEQEEDLSQPASQLSWIGESSTFPPRYLAWLAAQSPSNSSSVQSPWGYARA